MKSYFANAVETAMAQARKELGSDAVLVTTRLASPGVDAPGQYEVVFATDLPDSSAEPEQSNARPAVSSVDFDSLIEELRDLRRQFHSWRNASPHAADQPRWMVGEPALEEAFRSLVDAEVDREMAEQLIASVQRRLRPAPMAAGEAHFGSPGFKLELSGLEAPLEAPLVQAALAEEIENSFQVDASLGEPRAASRMVALVGPPGAGKTAMIARMAIHYGLSGRRPTILLSLDTLRVAASEQLRWYASILGLGFQSVPTNRALGQALEEHRNKELILIDTAGLAERDMAEEPESARFLAGRDDIQKHLVLPASLRGADMGRIAAAYRRTFQPSRLIFTRMDEASAFGPVLCEASRSGLPISFFSHGQRVPEDGETAKKAALTGRILPVREAMRTRSAA